MTDINNRENQKVSTLLERIKELAVIGMFSDDDFLENLVLKGGNALDLIYKISSRASVDVDFSMAADFPGGIDALRGKAEAAINTTYLEEGLKAFDFRVSDKPRHLSDDLVSFWGGYEIEFKLIELSKFELFSNNIDQLRKHAINLGQGPKFMIDVSRYEYLVGKVPTDFQGYRIFVYSLQMIVAEKLRAICQQMPEYGRIVKRERAGSSRARDFLDIHLLAKTMSIDMTTPENKALIASIFHAKYVPLNLLNLVGNYKAFHEASFDSVRDTIKSGSKIESFDYYFNFVVDLIRKLQPFGDV